MNNSIAPEHTLCIKNANAAFDEKNISALKECAEQLLLAYRNTAQVVLHAFSLRFSGDAAYYERKPEAENFYKESLAIFENEKEITETDRKSVV